MRLEKFKLCPHILKSHLFFPERPLSSIHHLAQGVGPGEGFFALKGLKTDGHLFVPEAIAGGAAAIFVSDPVIFEQLISGSAPPAPTLGGVFLVPDGRQAMAQVASYLHDAPTKKLTLFGITGTNGKTTTAFLVSQILTALGTPPAMSGGLGLFLGPEKWPTERTTPEATELERFFGQALEQNLGTAVMEVTSIGIALSRVSELHFHALAFTNLTQDHLDFHGTMENYRDTKFSLFQSSQVGRAVVNLDDKTGASLVERLKGGPPPFTYSLQGPADLAYSDLQSNKDGHSGRLNYQGRQVAFSSPLLGQFNQYNLLTALSLLLAKGASLEEMVAVLPLCPGAPGRFAPVTMKAPFTVVVDYAHTPDALENALAAARALHPNQLWVVFGCGGDRDPGKRPLMGQIAEKGADKVILTSDNPRGEPPENILAEIASGLDKPGEAKIISDRGEAIRQTLSKAQPGDLVLIAGKGHETDQEINGKKHPFDDAEQVRLWDNQF